MLHSLQDYLKTGTRDLDHPIYCWCRKHQQFFLCTKKGDLHCVFPLDVLMVPLSALAFSADGERLTCDDFSLSETVCLGSFEFIADYFSGLSLSPRRVTQAPPSWAQPAATHHSHDRP
jgi:hypothetical protein